MKRKVEIFLVLLIVFFIIPSISCKTLTNLSKQLEEETASEAEKELQGETVEEFEEPITETEEEVVDPIQEKLNQIKEEYSLRYMTTLKKIEDNSYLEDLLNNDEAVKAGFNFFEWDKFDDVAARYQPKDFKMINNTFENMENRDSYLEYMVNDTIAGNLYLFKVNEQCNLMKSFSENELITPYITKILEKIKPGQDLDRDGPDDYKELIVLKTNFANYLDNDPTNRCDIYYVGINASADWEDWSKSMSYDINLTKMKLESLGVPEENTFLIAGKDNTKGLAYPITPDIYSPVSYNQLSNFLKTLQLDPKNFDMPEDSKLYSFKERSEIYKLPIDSNDVLLVQWDGHGINYYGQMAFYGNTIKVDDFNKLFLNSKNELKLNIGHLIRIIDVCGAEGAKPSKLPDNMLDYYSSPFGKEASIRVIGKVFGKIKKDPFMSLGEAFENIYNENFEGTERYITTTFGNLDISIANYLFR